jgi:hypothetical protein
MQIFLKQKRFIAVMSQIGKISYTAKSNLACSGNTENGVLTKKLSHKKPFHQWDRLKDSKN